MSEIISNISYTNKDFQTIFSELLDTVKKITYRWDPSISNESDPGVILLKVNALIADKCNYNIDKNSLETFPDSVTQDSNARQLFEQLGYFMKWYRAATTNVTMRWTGDTVLDDNDNVVNYTVPQFTMVTNDEGDIVYTLTESATLPTDGSSVVTPAVQGVASSFSLASSTLITTSDLDSHNRVYFDEYNVAQNGIFITNVSSNGSAQNNYSSWSRRDNLTTEELGQKIYKFGINKAGTTCYLEFPEDAETIIGSGIYVTYVRTNGSDGNIGIRRLERLYSEVKVSDKVTLDDKNFEVSNYVGGFGGEDPESIDEAYINYKRTIGTFNTLVTLRDYINAILNSGLVSNGFVCDRTNDVQNSYSIIQNDYDVIATHTYVEKDTSGEDLLSAFDLKLYLLQYNPSVTDFDAYNQTFTMISNTDTIEDYIYDNKSIQHNFISLENDKIMMIKNKYPIISTIIPQYKLTVTQATEVINNIKTALFNNYNSSKVNFGEEIEYNNVYSTILQSDERIKAVILNNIEYTSFAVYQDKDGFKEIAVSDNFKDNYVLGKYQNGGFIPNRKGANLERNVSLKYMDDTSYNVYIYNSGKYNLYSDKIKEFRNIIYGKSILAGVTPLLIKDDKFTYELDQNKVTDAVDNVVTISTDVPFNFSNTSNSVTVRANEDLQFYAPNLLDVTEYSTYVKYDYVLNSDIDANTEKQLSGNEFVIFFWKENEDDTYYSYTKYDANSDINIIKPSFRMIAKANPEVSSITDLQGTGVLDDSALNETITGWVNANHVLTYTSKIVTRKLNEDTLKYNTHYCAWILNDKTQVGYDYVYRLFAPGESSYMLQAGEYFLYTGASKTDMAILGSGTKITRNTLSLATAWDCPIISADNVAANGLSELNDNSLWFDWKNVDKSATINVTEMQQITLGQDCIVTITAKNNEEFTIKIDSDGCVAKIGTEVVTLSRFNIKYQENLKSTPQTLPTIAIGDTSWDAISHLHIVTSYKEAQELLSNQKFVCTLDSGLEKTYEGNDANPVYLMSDAQLNNIGGHRVDTSVLYLNGTTGYVSIYPYNEVDYSKSDYVEKLVDKKFELTFCRADAEAKIKAHTTTIMKFNLPSGDYILPILNDTIKWYNNSGELKYSFDDVGVKFNGNSIFPIYDINQTITDFKEPKLWYLAFTVPIGVTEQQLTFTATVDSEAYHTQKLMLYPVFKYIAAIQDEDTFTSVSKKVSELDVNHVYDYTYTIDDDVVISNPLSASEFFVSNHPFCKYTIGQIDTEKSDVQVTNKIRS